MLNLPTEVVSSEYLTMESRQFSSSRGHVIYVRDVLSRYQPDALRYFLCAAAPESQDSDFSWREFVTRTNGELVAGWGNLVNRTASMIAKSFGEIPAAGPLTEADEELLGKVAQASTRSATSWAGTGFARPSRRRCASSARSTSTSRTRRRSSQG